MYDIRVVFSIVREISNWEEETRTSFFDFVEELAGDPWGKAENGYNDAGTAPHTWYRSTTWNNLKVDYLIFDDGGLNEVTILNIEPASGTVNFD